MRVESQKLAIELKYKTRHLLGIVGGEIYDLGDQAAQDLGRYDFFKDIERLERFVRSGESRSRRRLSSFELEYDYRLGVARSDFARLYNAARNAGVLRPPPCDLRKMPEVWAPDIDRLACEVKEVQARLRELRGWSVLRPDGAAAAPQV